ncbi:hypothetical protein [Ensifer soli]|uniref:hypothetical protein n=1 Tax=Ciceribacter sp. sgz301302 TaxID=3342379 RepID=UPI0035B7628D
MPEDYDEAAILTLLREAAAARWKTAKAVIDAYEADALPKPATSEELQNWKMELAEAANEIARLSN